MSKKKLTKKFTEKLTEKLNLLLNELRSSNWIQFKIFIFIYCNVAVSTCGFSSAGVISYWIIKLFQVYTFYRHEISNCLYFSSQLELTTWKRVKLCTSKTLNYSISKSSQHMKLYRAKHEVELCKHAFLYTNSRFLSIAWQMDTFNKAIAFSEKTRKQKWNKD